MNRDEYIEEDEEPPLLLSSHPPHSKYVHTCPGPTHTRGCTLRWFLLVLSSRCLAVVGLQWCGVHGGTDARAYNVPLDRSHPRWDNKFRPNLFSSFLMFALFIVSHFSSKQVEGCFFFSCCFFVFSAFRVQKCFFLSSALWADPESCRGGALSVVSIWPLFWHARLWTLPSTHVLWGPRQDGGGLWHGELRLCVWRLSAWVRRDCWRLSAPVWVWLCTNSLILFDNLNTTSEPLC